MGQQEGGQKGGSARSLRKPLLNPDHFLISPYVFQREKNKLCTNPSLQMMQVVLLITMNFDPFFMRSSIADPFSHKE